MDDLAGLLSQVMNDPQSMQQLQQVAASLGLGGDASGQNAQLPSAQNSGQGAGGVDLSALTALLGGQSSQPHTGSGGQPAAQNPASPAVNIDLSALSGLLGGLSSGAQNQPSQPSSGGNVDLSALSGLLGGLSGGAQNQPSQPSSGGNVDLSALSGLLGGLSSGTQNQPSQPSSGGNVDLSALSGLLGGLLGGQSNPPQGGGGADLSALTALLKTGQPSQAQQQQAPGLPFDMNTLFKLQKAMSSLAGNRANVDLLLALKPRLKEQRAKKVDDAIRVMQLIQFLPLIKESGLFGSLDGGLLGGLEGGLGGLVGNLGDGISGALNGLLGRR